MNNLALPKASTAGTRSGFSPQEGHENFSAENLAQPIDITRFGRENPRKSKEIQGIPTLINGVFAAKWAGPKKTQIDRCLPTKAFPPRPAVALAADADVVLRVAGGIVGIAGGIVRAEVRLSGGIDRLIGVAAGERERHKSQNDRDPHSRPPVQWRRGRRTKRVWRSWRSGSSARDGAVRFHNGARRQASLESALSGRHRARCCSARS
jgi:hypothetical protein